MSRVFIPECVRQTKLKHEKNPHAVFDALDQLFGILSLAEILTDVRSGVITLTVGGDFFSIGSEAFLVPRKT